MLVKRKKMKIFKIVIFTVAIACLSSSAYAQELKGIMYASNQTEVFDQNKVVREYIVDETAYCAFLVQGFSTDSSGSVNLTADIKFIDPQGNVLFEEKNYAKAKTSITKNQVAVMLDSSFDVGFTKEDPLGMYTVEALIKDNVSGVQDKTQTTLLLFDTNNSKYIIMASVKTAKQLDDLWSEFFRSKNPWAVKRIISALRLRKESSALDDAVIGSAAKWSLEVNAKKYPKVLSICKQSLGYSKGTIKELLQEIITNVEKNN